MKKAVNLFYCFSLCLIGGCALGQDTSQMTFLRNRQSIDSITNLSDSNCQFITTFATGASDLGDFHEEYYSTKEKEISKIEYEISSDSSTTDYMFYYSNNNLIKIRSKNLLLYVIENKCYNYFGMLYTIDKGLAALLEFQKKFLIISTQLLGSR